MNKRFQRFSFTKYEFSRFTKTVYLFKTMFHASRHNRKILFTKSRDYWRFNNYIALYELQEFKHCEKPHNKHHNKGHKNVTHCFILNGKELPIHYSTIADVFRDVFTDVYLRSFKVLHFRRGYVVKETPITFIDDLLSLVIKSARVHSYGNQNGSLFITSTWESIQQKTYKQVAQKDTIYATHSSS